MLLPTFGKSFKSGTWEVAALETMCYLFPNNINEMFCIFHNENDLTRLLCKLFFSRIYGASPTKDTTSRNTTIIRLDFSHFPCHPKVSERKLIRFALLFFLYYITFFSKKGRAVKLTSDVIRIIPAVIAYRSISSKSIVAIPLP